MLSTGLCNNASFQVLTVTHKAEACVVVFVLSQSQERKAARGAARTEQPKDSIFLRFTGTLAESQSLAYLAATPGGGGGVGSALTRACHWPSRLCTC